MTTLPTLDDLEWDLQAKKLKHTELERQHATAEKWRNGLGSLAALVGVTIAAGAPFVGEELDGKAKFWLGVAMFASLAFLTTGASLAMVASFGIPARILNTGPALKEHSRKAVDRSLCCLKWAGVLTVLGLIALAVSAGIAYREAGDKPESPTTGIVKVKSGAEVCGSLTWDDQGLIVTAASGAIHRFQLRSVVRVNYPKACP